MRGFFSPETKEERLQVRKAFAPKGAVRVSPKDVDVEFYLYQQERNGKTVYIVMAFTGTSSKPAFHYNFKNEALREAHYTEFAESKRKSAAVKTERKEKRKAAQHDWTVGMILTGSWGYDQTNVEFYQIIEISGKQATIRPIAQVDAGSTGDMSGYVRAAKNHFIGEPVKKLIQSYDGTSFYVSFQCFTLSPWSGEKRHQTSYA